jgi:hypothetical protein
MKAIIIFIMVFAQALMGCKGGYKLTANNYYVPDVPSYKLKNKFQLTDTSILSIDGIYQFNCYKDRWFKFYKDGRVLLGYNSNVPKNLSDPINGYAGYYKLEGNRLKMEVIYTQVRNDWYILVLEGVVKGDTILFLKDRPQGINRSIEHFTNRTPGCHYLKIIEPHRLLPADW